ncbi:hypothetical protein D3C76_1467990 [compost metagenome]
MLAVIAEWPAIEGAIFHRGNVVRHQVAADFVALVDRCPQCATIWLPGHAVRVAQARGEDPVVAGGTIHFPDCRAALLLVQAVFADVAVGAYRDVQLAAVLAGDDIFGPVVIQRAPRQVDDFDRL